MKSLILLTASSLTFVGQLRAHTIDHHEVVPHIAVPKVEFATIPGNRLVLGKKDGKIQALNTVPVARVAAVGSTPLPSASARLMQSAFGAFQKVKTRSDGRFFYIESDSIPDHNMMVGITAWQQQVPIPQPYTGNNAWQIPLNPVPARNPMSAKSHFFRGAIALAVNGVPIYNPIKNNGVTDTFLAGELDNWGGHCGRGDDYHYHIAPVHLQDQVGRGKPVAWALDGYPIYGYTEVDGAPARNLDRFNGHDHGSGYHYHATKTYPYLNGGFHGEVREVGGQVDPQPRPGGIRPYTRPLRGAKIVAFSGSLEEGYRLRYEIAGRPGYVNYKVAADRSARFTFIDTDGRQSTENFTPRNRGGGRGGDRNRRGGRDEERPPPSDPRQRSDNAAPERPRPDGDERGGRRGSPILSALDSNGDGEISRAELMNATAALRRLDQDGDGQVTQEEIRRPGGGPQPGRKGPPPAGEDRKPWIAAHFSELDTDRNGNVSKAEMLAEAAKTFAGYDRNRDGKLTADEFNGRSSARSAMGGFVKQHADEFDRNQNQIISREEVDAFALRMFTKADRDQNNIVTTEEANTRGGGGKGGRKDQKRPR